MLKNQANGLMVMYHTCHKPYAQFVKEPISLKPQSSSRIVTSQECCTLSIFTFKTRLRQDFASFPNAQFIEPRGNSFM